MARFLFILVVALIAGMSFLAVRYAKDSYKVLPMSDQAENQLESTLESEKDYENWQEFAPSSGAFKVLVPSTPQHVSDKTNDPKTKSARRDDVYIAEKKNGNVLMIHMITYEDQREAQGAEEDLLQNFMNDMLASNPQNKLVNSTPALYKGKKSLDFVIENETFNYDVRAFLHKNTVVVLSSVSRKPFHDIKDFEFFINSFEFIPTDHNPANA